MNENVVIIEDDPGVRFFLEEALKGEKYSYVLLLPMKRQPMR